MTPKKENRVLNGVNEITPGRSAMSENQKVVEVPEEFGNLCQKQLHTRPVAFRPHLSMGLALSKIGNDFVRLPSGISFREAKVKHFESGPLHNNLENGFE